MPRLTVRVEACTEILALLILVAWADGKLEDRERASIRSAASVLNLNRELRDRLDKALEAPIEPSEILVANLTPKDRAFAYVAAVWQANVDENLDPKEVAKLREVQSLLELDDTRADELNAIAKELGRPHEKDGWAHDLVALFKAIPSRLEASDVDEADVAFE